MRHVSLSCLAAAACVIALCACEAMAAPPAREPSVGLTFTQLDWLGPQGQVQVPCSPIVEAELSFRRSDTLFLGDEAGGGGAWINVVTFVPGSLEPEQWSIQNLRVSFPDVRYMVQSHPTVHFGLPLPPGTCLASLEHAVFVTPAPFPQQPLVSAWEEARVLDDDYLAGGRVSPDGLWWGGTGHSTIPLVPEPWGWWPPLPPPLPPPPLPIATRWAAQSVKGIEAVAELIDGCAPAAAVRSIKYLMGNAGEKTPQTTQMYNDLINEMGTVVGGQPDGGTTDDGIESGKDSYANDEGLPIDTTRSYGAPSFGQAFNNLGNGGDVELLIAWDGGGGHCAMVTSMTQYADGSYDITYVDDPDQSDGRAENAEHTIHVDASGDFDGGTVDGFVLETHQ